MGSYFDWQLEEMSAPVGSVEAEKMLEDAVRELIRRPQARMNVFVEHLPADNGG